MIPHITRLTFLDRIETNDHLQTFKFYVISLLLYFGILVLEVSNVGSLFMLDQPIVEKYVYYFDDFC